MKNIIFVDKSFAVGGIQSSMINLANKLSEKYEVSMLIYNPEGPLKERLNSNIKIITPCWQLNVLGMSFKESIRTKRIKFILYRFFSYITTKLINNSICINSAAKHQKVEQKFDLAISYHHEMGKHTVTSGFATITDKCINADKKIAWIHYDPSRLDYDTVYNSRVYSKMDKIVCVSKSVMEAFEIKYPMLKNKLEYKYNIINEDDIISKSKEKQMIEFPKDKYVCFSACRLTEEKGIERAITCLADVFKNNKNVVWYIAGDGIKKSNIQQLINKYDLNNQIVLIGNQKNPFPYIANCDLYLNLSYHEAAPMTFFEAKILGTRIFCTKTLSAEELVGTNGIICDNSSEGICSKFKEIIKAGAKNSNINMQKSSKGDVIEFIDSILCEKEQ